MYRYVYSCACSFCAVATLSRSALLFLAYLCSLCSRFSSLQPFHVSCFMICLFAGLFAVPFTPLYLYRRPPGAFAVPLRLNVCNVHFIRFLEPFKRLFLSCVHLHSLHRLHRLYSLICGKFAVLGEYRGAPPKSKRREAQLRSHRILYFLFPKKIFFLENSLSPFASCFPFQCQTPVFLAPLRICVPTRPRINPNLLKETPF